VRSIEDHQLGTGKPFYVISILENFSRAFLASAISLGRRSAIAHADNVGAGERGVDLDR